MKPEINDIHEFSKMAEHYDEVEQRRLGRTALEKLPQRKVNGKTFVSIPILPEVVRRRPKD